MNSQASRVAVVNQIARQLVHNGHPGEKDIRAQQDQLNNRSVPGTRNTPCTWTPGIHVGTMFQLWVQSPKSVTLAPGETPTTTPPCVCTDPQVEPVQRPGGPEEGLPELCSGGPELPPGLQRDQVMDQGEDQGTRYTIVILLVILHFHKHKDKNRTVFKHS